MTATDSGVKPSENLVKNFKESEKCRISPLYFLTKYAKIEDPATCSVIDWQPWQYLISLLDDFEANREVIIIKARQLGISWLACGYALWTVLFKSNANVLLLSQGEKEAWELLRKISLVFDHLPAFLKREKDGDRRDFLGFPSNGSRIQCLPSTIKAGSGYTGTLVIRDELDKHDYAEQNMAAIGPTVDSGKSKMIDLGSRDYTKAIETSHLMSRYLKARNHEIEAKAVFLGAALRPEREEGLSFEAWFERVKKKYPPYQIEKEYPLTEDDILMDSQTIKYFDKEGIEFIRRDCCRPIDTDGTVKIWAYPEPGVSYCAFLDPSDGSDPHAAGWMDSSTGRVVAISHGCCKAEKCAEIFDKYNRIYNNAYNEFELNAFAGKKVAEVLLSLKTPNRRLSDMSTGRENKYGWWTGGNMNSHKNIRELMLNEVELAVRTRTLRVHCGEVAAELDSMIKPVGESPRTPSGKHDDLIMMLGGLLCIKKEHKTVSGGEFHSYRRAARCF